MSAYSAGASISILTSGSTTPTVYTLTSTTTIKGLGTGDTLASPDRVVLDLSTSSSTTVTAIWVIAPRPSFVEGTVSAYSAGASISILTKGSTTPTVYTLTSSTTIKGLGSGDTIASPDRVVLELSATSSTTVTAIWVAVPRPVWVEGTVSAYSAGASISILTKGSTTPTVYTLTSSTTVKGLGSGDTLASPDRVALELSATSSTTVTEILVFVPRPVWVTGTVSAYSAGVSISILTKGSTTPTLYTLTGTTTIKGLGSGDTLASPDRVALELSATSSTTVTEIWVFAPRPVWVTGAVSAYSAGASISILTKGSTTPTVYTLTSTTTVKGLGSGDTLASPDPVALLLSATSSTTVTEILVLRPWIGGPGDHGNGHSLGRQFGSIRGAHFRI